MMTLRWTACCDGQLVATDSFRSMTCSHMLCASEAQFGAAIQHHNRNAALGTQQQVSVPMHKRTYLLTLQHDRLSNFECYIMKQVCAIWQDAAATSTGGPTCFTATSRL